MKLSEVSIVVKRSIIIGIAFIFLFIISKTFIVPTAKNAFLVLFPPKDLPNPTYGKLMPLEFIQQEIYGSNQTYELNTETGKLPTKFPKNMTVYRYEALPFSYNAGKRATQVAKVFGFGEDDLTSDLKGDIYTWRDIQTGGTLKIEINTRRLTLSTNLAGKAPYYKAGSIDKKQAVDIAKDLFREIGSYSDTLYQEGNQKVYLGKIHSGLPVETKATAEAQFARVDFFRKINKVPIVNSNISEGLLSAVVSAPNRNLAIATLRYPSANAYYWEIETQSNATYPIIPVATAWEAVKKGEGVITSVIPENLSPFDNYKPTRINEILINEIYLAYYDSIYPQKHLQPIYVFEGNFTGSGAGGKIAIYFPAISGEYIKTPEEAEKEVTL